MPSLILVNGYLKNEEILKKMKRYNWLLSTGKKKCPASLVIKEMQIESMTCNFTFILTILLTVTNLMINHSGFSLPHFPHHWKLNGPKVRVQIITKNFKTIKESNFVGIFEL